LPAKADDGADQLVQLGGPAVDDVAMHRSGRILV